MKRKQLVKRYKLMNYKCKEVKFLKPDFLKPLLSILPLQLVIALVFG